MIGREEMRKREGGKGWERGGGGERKKYPSPKIPGQTQPMNPQFGSFHQRPHNSLERYCIYAHYYRSIGGFRGSKGAITPTPKTTEVALCPPALQLQFTVYSILMQLIHVNSIQSVDSKYCWLLVIRTHSVSLLDLRGPYHPKDQKIALCSMHYGPANDASLNPLSIQHCSS